MKYELKMANGAKEMKQPDTTKFFAGIFIGTLVLLVAACCILGGNI